mmetsp:Transcript_48630/g.141726  ORF Transcript_48630/g.141726 Transcript_48630/m.141726 type:complete len:886 (+) Transcript_48630:76-2733(+)
MQPPPELERVVPPPAENQEWEVDASVPSQSALGQGLENSAPRGRGPSAGGKTRAPEDAGMTDEQWVSFSKSFKERRACAEASGHDPQGVEQPKVRTSDIFGAGQLRSHRAFEPGFEVTEEVQQTPGSVRAPAAEPPGRVRKVPSSLARTQSGKFRASSMRSDPNRFAFCCDRILRMPVVQIFFLVLTVGILFIGDLFQAVADVSYDDVLVAVLWVCAVFFALEWFMQVVASELQTPRYNFGLFFFLDLIATLSIALDIFVLEGNNLSDNGPVARAARAARLGTRAGRSVRLLRLLRFLRLVRIIRFIKVLLHLKSNRSRSKDREDAEEEFLAKNDGGEPITRADTIGAQIGATTTRKVVIMTLILLLFLPVLSPPDNMSVCNGEFVRLMEKVFESEEVGGNCTLMKEEIAPWFATGFVPFSQHPKTGLTVGGLMHAQVQSCVLYSNPELIAKYDPQQVFLGDRRRGNEIQVVPCDADFADHDVDGIDIRSPTYFLYDHQDEEVQTAVYSMMFTLVVIFTLLSFALIFASDAEGFASKLVAPIGQLMQDMAKTAKLQLDEVSTPEDLFGSNVYEIRKLQAAFLNLNGAVGSFVRFMPLEVVRHFLSIGCEAKLGVSQRTVTIFFSDIVGFANICESYPPVEVLSLLSEYFECMVAIIVEEAGTMLEFIGDSTLAMWNAPNSVPDHAVRGVTAALRMLTALEGMKHTWAEEGKPDIGIRCGLHSADVFVGNLGSQMRMKYGVLGDGVNLASRVEELNKRYMTEVVVSHDVLDQQGVKEAFFLRPLDRVVVKGRVKPTPIYEVLGFRSEDNTKIRRIAEHSTEAMSAYLRRDFDEAIQQLSQVLTLKDDRDPAGDVLRTRCAGFLRRPPPDNWDGAEVLNQKTFGPEG